MAHSNGAAVTHPVLGQNEQELLSLIFLLPFLAVPSWKEPFMLP